MKIGGHNLMQVLNIISVHYANDYSTKMVIDSAIWVLKCIQVMGRSGRQAYSVNQKQQRNAIISSDCVLCYDFLR